MEFRVDGFLYSFLGPFLISTWEPPSRPATFIICTRGNGSTKWNIKYIGETDNLAAKDFPSNQEGADDWTGLVTAESYIAYRSPVSLSIDERWRAEEFLEESLE